MTNIILIELIDVTFNKLYPSNQRGNCMQLVIYIYITFWKKKWQKFAIVPIEVSFVLRFEAGDFQTKNLLFLLPLDSDCFLSLLRIYTLTYLNEKRILIATIASVRLYSTKFLFSFLSLYFSSFLFVRSFIFCWFLMKRRTFSRRGSSDYR